MATDFNVDILKSTKRKHAHFPTSGAFPPKLTVIYFFSFSFDVVNTNKPIVLSQELLR
jgi:hypothetical protein